MRLWCLVLEKLFKSTIEEHNCLSAARTCLLAVRTCLPLVRTRLPVVRTYLQTVRTCLPVVRTCLPVARTCLPVVRTCLPVVRTCLPVARTCLPVVSYERQKELELVVAGARAALERRFRPQRPLLETLNTQHTRMCGTSTSFTGGTHY